MGSSSPFRFWMHSPHSLLEGDASTSNREGDVDVPFFPEEGSP